MTPMSPVAEMSLSLIQSPAEKMFWMNASSLYKAEPAWIVPLKKPVVDATRPMLLSLIMLLVVARPSASAARPRRPRRRPGRRRFRR